MSKDLIINSKIKELEQIISLLKEDRNSNSQALECSRAIDLIASALQSHYGTPGNLIKAFLHIYGLPDAYLNRILGARSRASEVLSGKRTPSLSDIKALKTHLSIPADVFLVNPETEKAEEIEFNKYPISELIKRGFVPQKLKKQPQDAMEYICQQAGTGSINNSHRACFRQLPRKNSKTDPYALQAWLLVAKIESQKIENISEYNSSKITKELLSDITHDLSRKSHCVKEVQRYLAGLGIRFVMVPHFKGTLLDGAVFFDAQNQPVIALTGRYDRLDNFWYTLLHEIAHLVLGHIQHGEDVIFDDMDIVSAEEKEVAADQLAQDSVIPLNVWKEFSSDKYSHSSILELALELEIAPAIIAGRVRYETKNYRAFTDLVGHGEVRTHFKEVVG